MLFVLLCRPDAVNLPYREIAEMAGVAHGTVGWVMPELPRLGFLVDVDKRRRLVERERLLVRWVEAYARRLRPKLLLGRYRTQDLELTTRIAVEQHNVLLGGETAAQRMTGHLRPGVATFYVHAAHAKYLIDLKLRPDPKGNVEFMKQFWNFEKPDVARRWSLRPLNEYRRCWPRPPRPCLQDSPPSCPTRSSPDCSERPSGSPRPAS